jgi:transcriptional regulator with XRE-family HTH domain
MKHSITYKNVNMRGEPLIGAQIRAARALVRWSAEDLARESAVSVATIRRAELTDKETLMNAANDLAIRHALEAAGVEFIDENGGGPGVRLKKPLKKRHVMPEDAKEAIGHGIRAKRSKSGAIS